MAHAGIVRAARMEDAPELAALSGELGYPAEAGDLESRLKRLIKDDDHAVWVACGPDGKVWGWAHVFLAHRLESALFAELGGLVVGEDRRGRGTGRVLVRVAEVWAADHGATSLRVRSREQRHQAHAFYRRLGFAQVKVQAVFAKPVEGGSESHQSR